MYQKSSRLSDRNETAHHGFRQFSFLVLIYDLQKKKQCEIANDKSYQADECNSGGTKLARE